MTKTDLQAVYDLVQTTIQVSYGDIYPPEAIVFFRTTTVKKIVKDLKAGYILVADCDGQTVGTGTLSGKEVRRVFIDAEFQGHGIGAFHRSRIET